MSKEQFIEEYSKKHGTSKEYAEKEYDRINKISEITRELLSVLNKEKK